MLSKPMCKSLLLLIWKDHETIIPANVVIQNFKTLIIKFTFVAREFLGSPISWNGTGIVVSSLAQSAFDLLSKTAGSSQLIMTFFHPQFICLMTLMVQKLRDLHTPRFANSWSELTSELDILLISSVNQMQQL